MKRQRLTQPFSTFAALATGFALALSMNVAAIAVEGSSGGDDFRQTALEYEEKAEEFRQRGNTDVAAIYRRLAEIKVDAAALADEGRWDEIDWSEYEALNEELGGLL